MKLERQLRRDVGIGALLERKADVQTDGLRIRLRSAAIGRFHDSRTAARANNETVQRIIQIVRPLSQTAGEIARVVIIARARTLLANAGRAEEHDGVTDFLAAEMRERLQILGEEPE